MKRYSYRYAWVAVLGLWLTGVAAATAVAQEAVQEAAQKHSLWRVSAEGGGTVYLQGSLHLLKPEHYPLNEASEAAFAASDNLVLEVDLGTMNNPVTQISLLVKGVYTNKQTLADALSPETYTLASEKLKPMNLDIAQFSRFRPWFFVMQVTVLKLESLGYSPANGVDMYFYRKAGGAGKPVEGLESAEEQMALFRDLTPEQQDILVRHTFAEFDVFESQLDAIVNAWSSGDAERLDTVLLKSFREYPELYERFLAARNRAWMKTIESLLKDDATAMVVVGVGHLVGADGLLALLAGKGYSIEQL